MQLINSVSAPLHSLNPYEPSIKTLSQSSDAADDCLQACHAQLQTEAPGLIPLFRLMSPLITRVNWRGVPACIDPSQVTAWMRWHQLRAGIRPAFWRLLCKSDTHWLESFLDFYNLTDQHVESVAIDLVTMAQAFGTEKLVPAWLLRSVLQIGGNPNTPCTFYVRRLDDLFPVCRRLGHLWNLGNVADQAVLKGRSIEIFQWASDHAKQYMPATIRKASLAWFIRKVDDLAERTKLQLEGAKPWKTPYKLQEPFQTHRLPDTSIQAVILSTPLAIWEEGKTMRHCARMYIGLCQIGYELMVSLRSPDQKTPLATVSYVLASDKLHLKRIAGFANQLVDPAVYEVAKEVEAALQVQHLALPKTRNSKTTTRKNTHAHTHNCIDTSKEKV